MFAKIARPSSTAVTIDAKLSSVRTMSAASFVTSVPVMPMATPMSAVLERRGVVDAVAGHGHDLASPLPESVGTMRSLCSAVTRA